MSTERVDSKTSDARTRTNDVPEESETVQEDAGKTQEPTSPPLFQAGFWDKDPETTRHRNNYFKIVIMGCFLVIIVIFGYLSIYWGSLWAVNKTVHNMNAWVVVSTVHAS